MGAPPSSSPPLIDSTATAAVEQKASDLFAQIDAHRELSTDLGHHNLPA